MKDISKFILEALKINKDITSVKADDPSQWEVGDILCGYAGYTMMLPRFYKIVKRTAKQFTVARIPGKIVSGRRNGQWKEIADEDAPISKETVNARINKRNKVYINKDILVELWDGQPLHGDDMD